MGHQEIIEIVTNYCYSPLIAKLAADIACMKARIAYLENELREKEHGCRPATY